MTSWLQIILTIFTSVLASSGLWAFIGNRFDKRSAERDLIIGIGHVELVYYGMQYIERGWITKDEYETLKELYDPYIKLGGNGSGKKIMAEVEKLPMHPNETR